MTVTATNAVSVFCQGWNEKDITLTVGKETGKKTNRQNSSKPEKMMGNHDFTLFYVCKNKNNTRVNNRAILSSHHC
jgi:hypothetical protein